MYKKIFAAVLAVSMTASLAACGGSSSSSTTAASSAAEETTAAETTAEETTEAETKEGDTTAAETETTAAETEAAADLKTVTDGKLTMVTNAEFQPYEYHDANEIVGIDVDICSAIAEKLGLELEIEDIAFDSIIPELTSGKADIAAAGMTVTEDRKQNVDFSDPYAVAKQVIIVKEGSDIKSADDLAGKKIGVQQGTTGDIYITDDLGDDAVERYSKGMEAVQALSQGKVDAVVIDNEPAKQFVSEVEGLTIIDSPYTEEEYAIAVKKGNTAMLDAVNGALKDLKDQGKLDEIVAKYIKAE